MSDAVHRYVIAYDIASDSRRVRVAKTLESYGDRLQYSVFLIDTKPARMVRLQSAVTAQMDLSTDSLLVCDLGPRPGLADRRLDFVGVARSFTGDGPMVV